MTEGSEYLLGSRGGMLASKHC